MQYESLCEEIEAYVVSLFQQHPVPALLYHNLEHTRRVVASCKEIAAYYNLGEDDRFVLQAAAWFHDSGHLVGDMEHHEENGSLLMKRYFEDKGIDAEIVARIAGCIMATKYPSHPHNLLEEIICDADTYHFGTSYFQVTDELVRQELEVRLHLHFAHWHIKALQLLMQHHFFTVYCRQLLEAGKQMNIEYLQKKIKEEEKA
ncbi:MAG: HD domain-containing protein [Chitinophagaceae bacterium]